MTKGEGTKMDPSQYQSFFKAMITKEEKFYGVKDVGKGGGPLAKDHHLTGSGAHVKGGVNAASPKSTIPAIQKMMDEDVGSQAGSAKGSKAGSQASTTAKLMDRLQRLEQEVVLEKEKRQAAEAEMKELLNSTKSAAATPRG